MYEDIPIPLGPKPKTKSRVSKKFSPRIIFLFLFFFSIPPAESLQSRKRQLGGGNFALFLLCCTVSSLQLWRIDQRYRQLTWLTYVCKLHCLSTVVILIRFCISLKRDSCILLILLPFRVPTLRYIMTEFMIKPSDESQVYDASTWPLLLKNYDRLMVIELLSNLS